MFSRVMVVGTVVASALSGSTWSSAASAQTQTRVIGQVGTEVRGFFSAAQFGGQERHMASSFFAPSIRIELAPGQALKLSPFVRLISDRPATEPVAYLRTLSWAAAFPGGTAEVGIQTVRWGSSRSTSPVDVVNQKDRSFHPFANARIGQPMVRLSIRRGSSGLEVLLMSRGEPRLFPGPPARLRSASWVDSESPRYVGRASGPIEIAGRWSVDWRSGAVAVSVLRGAARDPGFERIPGALPALGTVYAPYQQVGVEGRWMRGAWIFRSESALRQLGNASPYAVTVVGLERAWRSEAGTVTVTAEYIADSRGRQAGSLTQDDFYFEARLRSSSPRPFGLVVKALIDRESRSTVGTAALSRRVLERWLVELGSWQFWGKDLGALQRDGYMWVSLRRNF